MAIQPIQNRIFGFPVDASTEVSEEERRKKENSTDSKASKKRPQKFTVQPSSEDAIPDTSLEGQIIDSQNVIELLNHKPAEPRNYQQEKLRQAVKKLPQNSSHLNKKL